MKVRLLGIATMVAVGMVTVTGWASAQPGPAVERSVVSNTTVQVDYDYTPRKVWWALRAKGYVGVAGDGCECLYVPEGTRVGKWVAKRERDGGRRAAAREVLAAYFSGKRVYEDHSYRGMSANLAEWNDVLVKDCYGQKQIRCLTRIASGVA